MIGPIGVFDVSPVVACGAWPAKAVVGEAVRVSATVFRDGHGIVGATIVVTDPTGRSRATRMRQAPGPRGTDGFVGDVTVDAPGRWSYLVEGWADAVGTWRHAIEVKVEAGQDVTLELAEGAELLAQAATSVPDGWREAVRQAAAALRDESRSDQVRLARALDPALVSLLDRHPMRDLVTPSPSFSLRVDRERALCGAWYELFPRSEGADMSVTPPRSGTFTTAAERLPGVAAMGFDVVYLPPIHPIGESFRKGRNNTLDPAPYDVGSPWAIGSTQGGHDALHPDLGTIADFDAFVERARSLGLEVALDLALQCSPDHPWAKEHPEWFHVRPDGSIAYAENPPKRYQDIYPINFDVDPDGLRAEVLRIVRHWMDHGVRIFRVDNPHTKPLAFWEWLITEVARTDPDVIWLAEAFTRPPMMHALAMVGFSQSYTYFTWRTEKRELERYLLDLSRSPTADYMRPNFFTNTPDILPSYLQYGGPPAFKVRAVLAALLSPSYGIYAGYELFEHVAVRPGSEEYLDSEKYQLRPRDWDAAVAQGRSLAPYLTMLNRIRREHPALHRLRNLTLHDVDNDSIMAFSKRLGSGMEADAVLVVVNLDPHGPREGTVSLDLPALGVGWDDRLVVHDAVTGASYDWGQYNYVRLDPFIEPAHIFTIHHHGG